ncbi:metallothionein [Synechococcus sp. UW105]|uniref:metallothionein n=1 Tax=unclassified Synechococcus TaxID=2626047 RepID=UPI000E0FD2FA|nr:metallothionein [Synechococcus sp. UW105]
MTTSLQICACEPSGCSMSRESAVEKVGELYCSQPCADGHEDHESCCTTCDCC